MLSVIEVATPEDLAEIARVHIQTFVGYFLSAFGAEFLELYYRNYLSDDNHILLTAKEDNRIVGFIAGSAMPDLLEGQILRLNFIRIFRLSLKRLIISGDFRKQCLERRHFVKRALKAKCAGFFRKDTHNLKSSNTMREIYGGLSSIAVLPEYRGKGVALSLIKKFEAEMARKGLGVCALTVTKDNSRAISFYKKAGWRNQIRKDY